MTVIVGLTTSTATYLGGDASASDDASMEIRLEPKVWRDGHWILGLTPSFRMAQILTHHISLDDLLPSPANCTLHDLVSDLIPVLQETFLKEPGSMDEGWHILLGGQGYLWTIQDDYAISEVESFSAIGSGSDYALGALHILDKCLSSYSQPVAPRLQVLYACRAAARWCLSVEGPFSILKSERTLPR